MDESITLRLARPYDLTRWDDEDGVGVQRPVGRRIHHDYTFDPNYADWWTKQHEYNWSERVQVWMDQQGSVWEKKERLPLNVHRDAFKPTAQMRKDLDLLEDVIHQSLIGDSEQIARLLNMVAKLKEPIFG